MIKSDLIDTLNHKNSIFIQITLNYVQKKHQHFLNTKLQIIITF